MYRSNGENSNDKIASVLGLNSLNTSGLQDMYSDAENLLSAVANASSPTTMDDKKDLTLLPEQTQANGTFLGSTLPNMATILFEQQQAQQLRLIQQQKLLHQQQQQQFAQQQLMQQQIAMSNAVNSNPFQYHQQQHHQQDEISHSLKMFAMFSAYSDSQTGQVDVMQDFASNGYTSDYLYRNNSNQGLLTTATQSQQQLLQQLQTQSWFDLNYADLRKGDDQNQWRIAAPSSNMASSNKGLPSSSISAAITANGVDVNNSVLPEQNLPSKPKTQKRQNGHKEKYASSKHCVFCENNNEADAVVKSHSVRDSLGRVLCPKLRTYVCPICKASGDMAHTIKYCPKKPIVTMEDALKAESFRLARSAYFKQQMKV